MSVLEKFISEEIVPDLVDHVPSVALTVSYPSGAVVDGVELTPTQVKDEPKINYVTEEGAIYSLLMTGNIF